MLPLRSEPLAVTCAHPWLASAHLQMGLLLWMNMVPSLALVVEWLDESTLGLLFGMMIIVGRLKDTVSSLHSTCLPACPATDLRPACLIPFLIASLRL